MRWACTTPMTWPSECCHACNHTPTQARTYQYTGSANALKDEVQQTLTVQIEAAHTQRDELEQSLRTDLKTAQSQRHELEKELQSDLQAALADRDNLDRTLRAQIDAAYAQRDELETTIHHATRRVRRCRKPASSSPTHRPGRWRSEETRS